jgi:hypothetical protein
LDDVGSDTIKAERLTVGNGGPVTQIAEMMASYKAIGDFIFGLKCELIFGQSIDMVGQTNRLERPVFGGIKILQRASNDQLWKYCLQLTKLGALVGPALTRQKSKARPTGVLNWRVRFPTVSVTRIEVEPQSPPAPRANVLRNSAFPEPVQSPPPIVEVEASVRSNQEAWNDAPRRPFA